MDLELQQEQLHGYETAEDTITQEETTERIIPEYCPDIGRILDTRGSIAIHKSELTEDRLTISGAVDVTVLYIPEDTGALRALSFSVPFTCHSGERAFAECTAFCVCAQVQGIDARLLNPRKLNVRMQLALHAKGYRPAQLQLCTQPVETASLGIELLQEEDEESRIIAVKEKSFTVSEEMVLSGTKEAIDEILFSQARPLVTEGRIMGGKIIVKGVFSIALLYRSTEQNICTASLELPFSQILDGGELPEGAYCDVPCITLSEAQVRAGEGGDARSVDVTLQGSALAAVRHTQKLRFLTDLYSTKYELFPQSELLTFSAEPQTITRREAVRETLELGVVVKSVLAAWVHCSPVSVSRDGAHAQWRTMAQMKVLYLDEGGTPLMAQRSTEVSGEEEISENAALSLCAACSDEVMSALSGAGIELRFNVDISGTYTPQHHHACISAVRADMDTPRDMSDAPSLVLRRIQPSERIWDLAKQYNSTVRDILASNDMTSESERTSDFLLIPRKRS